MLFYHLYIMICCTLCGTVEKSAISRLLVMYQHITVDIYIIPLTVTYFTLYTSDPESHFTNDT
jgi:hypothetical protein